MICKQCFKEFTPTELDHVPFFLCPYCSRMNKNPDFNRYTHHERLKGTQERRTWGRRVNC